MFFILSLLFNNSWAYSLVSQNSFYVSFSSEFFNCISLSSNEMADAYIFISSIFVKQHISLFFHLFYGSLILSFFLSRFFKNLSFILNVHSYYIFLSIFRMNTRLWVIMSFKVSLFSEHFFTKLDQWLSCVIFQMPTTLFTIIASIQKTDISWEIEMFSIQN